jgi:putative ABC transport system substrate-binding protein
MVTRRRFISLLGGSIVALPGVVTAQTTARIRRIGVLSVNSNADPETRRQFAAFTKALEDLGWKQGSNVRIDYRFGNDDVSSMPKLAKEIIDLQPDVIVGAATPAATALRQRTLSIPIVFVQVPDPVAAGFVTNLARPEGNITGFTNFEFSVGEKWLQVIKECAPKVNRVMVVFDPANPSWAAYTRAIEAAAPKFGMRLTPAGVRDRVEIEREIAAFAKAPNGALIVLPSPVTVANRDLIVSVAAKTRLPAVYPYHYFTESGGLMSYGIELLDLYRRAAAYVDRILKGAKPADLPVQQPNKLELVINLKTAKSLGMTIPPSILLRADRVIQ